MAVLLTREPTRELAQAILAALALPPRVFLRDLSILTTNPA